MQLRRTPNNWRKLHTAWRTATAGLLCPGSWQALRFDGQLLIQEADTRRFLSGVRLSRVGTFRGKRDLRITKGSQLPGRSEFRLWNLLSVNPL